MNAFTQIEKVLAFHHTTTKSPMLLKDLVKKANVTLKDAKDLLASWPAGYEVMRVGLQDYVASSEIAMNLQCRSERMKREYKTRTTSTPMRTVTNTAPRANKIIKSSTIKPKQSMNMNMDQILQKVQQKQAQAQQVIERREHVRREFLMSQVPAVEGVLRALATFSRSVSLSEVIRKVQSSTKSSLDVQEVEQILTEINFVKIINAGGVRLIELRESDNSSIQQVAIKA